MHDGGGRERLAPVIPLFGGSAPGSTTDAVADEWPRGEAQASDEPEVGVSFDVDVSDHVEVSEPAGDSDGPGDSDGAWHPTWTARRESPAADDDGMARQVDLAEKALLKKLRTRSLSIAEARGILREHDLDAAATDQVLASMEEYGYLDDAVLAEQLVHLGVDRKGQGRQAIAQTLAKRGVPRDVADAALAQLADDDFERALEFARSKARSMRSLDRDTALRRLMGQLSRRGYGGSIAVGAARAALDESALNSGGVRFH